MSNTFKNLIYVCLGLVLIFLIIMLVSLKKMNNALSALSEENGHLQNEINTLDNSIQSIRSSFYSQINELKQITEENSRIYYDNDYKIINYNSTTDMVNIDYYFKLKEYTTADTVNLIIGISNDVQKIEMTNNNGVFNVNVDIESKKTYSLSISIDGELTRTQSIGELNIYNDMYDRFGQFYPQCNFIGTNDKIYLEVGLSVYNNYSLDPKLKFKSGFFNLSCDNVTLIDIPNILTIIEDHNNIQSIAYKKEFLVADQINENDFGFTEDIALEIEFVDYYGFVYSYTKHYK